MIQAQNIKMAVYSSEHLMDWNALQKMCSTTSGIYSGKAPLLIKQPISTLNQDFIGNV